MTSNSEEDCNKNLTQICKDRGSSSVLSSELSDVEPDEHSRTISDCNSDNEDDKNKKLDDKITRINNAHSDKDPRNQVASLKVYSQSNSTPMPQPGTKLASMLEKRSSLGPRHFSGDSGESGA